MKKKQPIQFDEDMVCYFRTKIIDMNILLIGSGGREHALAMKLSQSPHCDNLYIAPGNAGTANCGVNLDIKVTDFEAIKKAVVAHNISMVVVGPEEPLVKGIRDFFKTDEQLNKVMFIGPDAHAAQLEGSKAFAKAFMQRHQIPTAAYREFTRETKDEGIAYISEHSLPIVLKADGLAAGKGVLICQSHAEAITEFEQMVLHAKFGDAGNKVVVESFLKGIEMSVFVLTDGKDYLLLPEAKDYKRIGAGDTGLNTGGMGAVSPVSFFDDTLKQKVVERIIKPTINGLSQEDMDYKGFVFFGLMIDNGEPYVIEYNCRMGDPETEVVIPRIENSLVELFTALCQGKITASEIKISPTTWVVTVLVSGGYPGAYVTGLPITGLEKSIHHNGLIFHAGTTKSGEDIVTNGGRVIAVAGVGDTVSDAAKHSRNLAKQIRFEGMYYRHDIGYEFGSELKN